MSDFITYALLPSFIGLVVGLMLIPSHIIANAMGWHYLTRYAYGCFWVFMGLSVYVWLVVANFWLIIGLWLVLGITGLIVAASYGLDKALALYSQREAKHESINSKF